MLMATHDRGPSREELATQEDEMAKLAAEQDLEEEYMESQERESSTPKEHAPAEKPEPSFKPPSVGSEISFGRGMVRLEGYKLPSGESEPTEYFISEALGEAHVEKRLSADAFKEGLRVGTEISRLTPIIEKQVSALVKTYGKDLDGANMEERLQAYAQEEVELAAKLSADAESAMAVFLETAAKALQESVEASATFEETAQEAATAMAYRDETGYLDKVMTEYVLTNKADLLTLATKRRIRIPTESFDEVLHATISQELFHNRPALNETAEALERHYGRLEAEATESARAKAEEEARMEELRPALERHYARGALEEAVAGLEEGRLLLQHLEDQLKNNRNDKALIAQINSIDANMLEMANQFAENFVKLHPDTSAEAVLARAEEIAGEGFLLPDNAIIAKLAAVEEADRAGEVAALAHLLEESAARMEEAPGTLVRQEAARVEALGSPELPNSLWEGMMDRAKTEGAKLEATKARNSAHYIDMAARTDALAGDPEGQAKYIESMRLLARGEGDYAEMAETAPSLVRAAEQFISDVESGAVSLSERAPDAAEAPLADGVAEQAFFAGAEQMERNTEEFRQMFERVRAEANTLLTGTPGEKLIDFTYEEFVNASDQPPALKDQKGFMAKAKFLFSSPFTTRKSPKEIMEEKYHKAFGMVSTGKTRGANTRILRQQGRAESNTPGFLKQVSSGGQRQERMGTNVREQRESADAAETPSVEDFDRLPMGARSSAEQRADAYVRAMALSRDTKQIEVLMTRVQAERETAKEYQEAMTDFLEQLGFEATDFRAAAELRKDFVRTQRAMESMANRAELQEKLGFESFDTLVIAAKNSPKEFNQMWEALMDVKYEVVGRSSLGEKAKERLQKRINDARSKKAMVTMPGNIA